MVPCIVSIFQCTCISNKMQRYTVYLSLETALHVSGGTFTHHKERIQLYLQRLVFVTPLLLSAAIVEKLELVWVAYTTHSTLKPVPTLPRKRQIAVTVWQIPGAVDTVVCAPDDEWKYHPKHVEQFPDINKLCNVASCWKYIGILLGAHTFFHISRIRVKGIVLAFFLQSKHIQRTLVVLSTVFSLINRIYYRGPQWMF
jgi:hypothetical protein